jgi:hypothetical protein
MEKRPYFLIGDLLANALVATVAVAFTAWLIGGTWGTVPGMLAGMVLGMAIALPLILALLLPLLGVMEVIAPCMLSGMVGGMWGGMWPLVGAGIFRWGLGTGVAVFVIVYAISTGMSGPQRLEN